jgi:hypothetical protein
MRWSGRHVEGHSMKQHDPDAVARIERETWDRSAASYRDNAAKLTSHAINLLIDAARGMSRSLLNGSPEQRAAAPVTVVYATSFVVST